MIQIDGYRCDFFWFSEREYACDRVTFFKLKIGKQQNDILKISAYDTYSIFDGRRIPYDDIKVM